MQRAVVCKLKRELYHRYKDAPEPVWYLRNLHRHELDIEVTLEVFHNDREIEFIMLKHEINSFLDSLKFDTPNNENDGISCEMIAESIVTYLSNKYGQRYVQVEVLEDGENGACVAKFI